MAVTERLTSKIAVMHVIIPTIAEASHLSEENVVTGPCSKSNGRNEVNNTAIKTCSFIILNYNSAHETMSLANSVSEYKCVESVIVVDNCSTDDSLRYLHENNSEEKISIIVTDRNGGYGYGNNFGMRYLVNNKPGSPLAVVANPDTSIEESDLLTLIECMNSHENCIAVGGVQRIDNTQEVLLPWSIPDGLKCVCAFGYISAKLNPFDSSRDLDLSHTSKVGCLRGALVLFDCRKFLSLGGYDENIFLYYEETVVGIKAARAGYASYYCPEASYCHKVSGSISKSTDAIGIRRHYIDSLLYVVKAYYNFPKWKIALCKLIGQVTLPTYWLRGVKHRLWNRR